MTIMEKILTFQQIWQAAATMAKHNLNLLIITLHKYSVGELAEHRASTVQHISKFTQLYLTNATVCAKLH